MPTLKTPRLTLRPVEQCDLEDLAAMNADPEVMRFIGDGSTRTAEQTETWVAQALQDWLDRGFGLFVAEIAASGGFAGWVTLTVPSFLPEVLPAVEIGWRFARTSWGRGFATEAAHAVLRFGLMDRQLDRVVSIRHVDNDASRRVMEKLGLRFEQQTVVPATGQPVAVYAITQAEYEAGTADRRGSCSGRSN
jgi:RimJ/RimL family protein N-acetyltransferase